MGAMYGPQRVENGPTAIVTLYCACVDCLTNAATSESLHLGVYE